MYRLLKLQLCRVNGNAKQIGIVIISLVAYDIIAKFKYVFYAQC